MTPEQAPQGAPPIEETRYSNTPVAIGARDEDGRRELTFVVAPLKLITFILPADLQQHMVKEFTGGIEVARPGDVPAAPSD